MANKLRFTDKYIEITCDRTDSQSQYLAGQIPYVHRNRTNTIFHTTLRNIELVLRLFRNIDYDSVDKLPPAIRKLYDAEVQRQIATKTLLELGPDGETAEGEIKLWRHQQLGREIAQVNPRFGFFYDTRTGKTPMSLQIIQDDVDANPGHVWLVLCPLILIENAWLQDARDMFPRLKVVSLHDTNRNRRLEAFNKPANLFLLNIESFVNYRQYVEKLPIHGAFVDESSTMKSNSSKFAQESVEYAQTLRRWYLLSGTPAPNGEWEYYRQLQSIDYFGIHQSFNQFKLYFFNNSSRNPQYEKLEVKQERREELLSLLKRYSLYVDKEDVLKTPGRDFIEIKLTLPEQLREQYDQLRTELCLELGDGLSVVAPSTAASLNKLNQVTSGFVIDTAAMKHNKMVKQARKDRTYIPPEYDVIKDDTHLLSLYRFEALSRLLDESVGNQQAIIWCVYKKEFEILKERLGDKCACVYGETNITEKNAAIKAFKEGRIQFLIANPASADKGLTLTNAHIAIYFSLGYSYELWKQSIERIYGDIIKQSTRCTYYIFIASNTVDRAIYTTVKNKGDMSMAILEHLKGGL